MTTTVTEFLTSPPVVVTSGAGTVAVNSVHNWIDLSMPLYINIVMACYLTVMLIHKLYQLYREFKQK